MLQSERWRESLAAAGPQWSARTVGVFATPILERNAKGRWQAPPA
jgi:hypothetical protein